MNQRKTALAQTARHDRRRKRRDSFDALALYATAPPRVKFDPRLSLAVDRALVALEGASDAEKQKLTARLRELERRAFGEF